MAGANPMRSRSFLVGAWLPFALLLAGCTVPLGPGYRIRSETVRVRYLPAASELAVGADWRLRNTGNGPLDALRLDLPVSRGPAAAAPAAEVNATPAAVSPAAGAHPGRFLLAVDPPWRRKKDGNVKVRYRLAVGSAATPGPAAFYLDFADWFPEIAPPPGRFSHGGSRGREVDLEIFVPRLFRVLTSGELREFRVSAGGLAYRFSARRRDGRPFLLVGRYQEQKFATAGREVILWTLEPLPPGEAKEVATRLARAYRVYRKAFGPVRRYPGPLRIAEEPGGGRGGRAFADGVLLDESWFAQARTSPDFLSAERALAGAWFGVAVRPERDAAIVLGEGAAEYAALLAEESIVTPSARRAAVTAWLERYDRNRASVKELPLAQIDPERASPAVREMAASKAALFFIALEDQCGPANVRGALAHLVHSLRDSSAGLAELRAALEQAAGQDLAGFFREWLEHVGIPATFRARYPSDGHSRPVE
jgi:hypothetical protein